MRPDEQSCVLAIVRALCACCGKFGHVTGYISIIIIKTPLAEIASLGAVPLGDLAEMQRVDRRVRCAGAGLL